MTPSVTELAVWALATWQAVEVWHHSALMAGPRAFVEARGGWWARLTGCPFCLSVWVGFFVIAVWRYPLPDGDELWQQAAWLFVGFSKLVILALAVSRLANLGNDLVGDRCRTPRENEPDLNDDTNNVADPGGVDQNNVKKVELVIDVNLLRLLLESKTTFSEAPKNGPEPGRREPGAGDADVRPPSL